MTLGPYRRSLLRSGMQGHNNRHGLAQTDGAAVVMPAAACFFSKQLKK